MIDVMEKFYFTDRKWEHVVFWGLDLKSLWFVLISTESELCWFFFSIPTESFFFFCHLEHLFRDLETLLLWSLWQTWKLLFFFFSRKRTSVSMFLLSVRLSFSFSLSLRIKLIYSVPCLGDNEVYISRTHTYTHGERFDGLTARGNREAMREAGHHLISRSGYLTARERERERSQWSRLRSRTLSVGAGQKGCNEESSILDSGVKKREKRCWNVQKTGEFDDKKNRCREKKQVRWTERKKKSILKHQLKDQLKQRTR